MRSLMIIETEATGHSMVYVRRIARQAISQGIRTQLLTMPSSLQHPSYRAMQEELGERVETHVLQPSSRLKKVLYGQNLYARQIVYYRLFAHFLRNLAPSERPDHVLMPFVDQCDKVISLLGSPFGGAPWSCLAMQYKFHYGTMGALRPSGRSDRVKERLFVRLLKNKTLQTLFTIDELLLEYVQQRHPGVSTKVQYVGDPVDMEGDCTREEARARFGIPLTRQVLLIYGAVSLRKGIETVLAASQEPNFPPGLDILVAGSQDPPVQELLAGPVAQSLRAQGRLYEHQGFLDDDAEYAAFKAADMVWLGYQGHYGMSGVMIQAGKMGLPVIACREGLIGWMSARHCLGRVVDVGDIPSVAAAAAALTSDPQLSRQFGEGGRRLANRHTSTAFAQTILSGLWSQECPPT